MSTLLITCSRLSFTSTSYSPSISDVTSSGNKQESHSYSGGYNSFTASFLRKLSPCLRLATAAQCRQLQCPVTNRLPDAISNSAAADSPTPAQPLVVLKKAKEEEVKVRGSSEGFELWRERWGQTKRRLIRGSSLGAHIFGAHRFVITASQTIITAADYKINFSADPTSDRVKRLHRRAARRMLRVCKSHGGIYNKVGQYISTLNHILPEEYTTTMAELTDRATSLPWSEIRQVLQDDFSPSYESQHFSSIDETPIGSASLAQVHHGVRRSDGAEVAVKIQYPHLRAQTRGDMMTLEILVAFIGFLFPEYGFGWLFPEFEQSISQELDFYQEGFNAERVASILSHRKDVCVPKIDWDLTSSRCLVMEFAHGVKVTDFTKLKEAGIDPVQLAKIICDVFGEMIHVHGFIQCDPHPGNILVRKDSQKGVQLILLDHGMYRRVEPRIRFLYCQLWRSLLTQDVQLGKQICGALGISETSLDLLSLLFTYRSMKSKLSPLGAKMDPTDRENAKAQFKGYGLADINQFLHSLPRDILWIFRGTNIVRSLNHYLGNTTHSRLLISSYNVAKGIHLGATIGGIDLDEVTALENRILDEWIDSNLPRLDPSLLEGDALFPQWWIVADGDNKPALGPLSRKILQARVSERLHSNNPNTTTADEDLPPPLCLPVGPKSSRPFWLELPGIATLNLPVCSEVVEWKRARSRRSFVQFVRSLWMQMWAGIDRLYFGVKLWGFALVFWYMEEQVETIFTRIMPYTPLQE